MLWIKVALDIGATLWTPTIEVSLEEVRKTGKRGIFLRKYLKRLRKKCIAGSCIGYIRLPQSQKLCIYIK
jgi:hypothetical protein